MFVSKKKYDFLLDRYEQAASRADQLERQLAEMNVAMAKHGTPYKCILECREAAMAVSTPGSEEAWLTLERLAFVDRWISSLLPALTRQMPVRERRMWEEMLDIRSAEDAYGMVHRPSQGETR
ncbi:hypothetical protein G5W58_003936 [Salmonella enterica subsp. enterica]|uniref:Uncharacterized protein n=2 Tax=Salmonella enterica TaxID=28901 RepID=A0A8F6P5J8_SALET|nr:hypothetical protein [Salmonella enterica]EDQ0929154.1 hypothetical protein [Salmonella enterica subsp. enterica serovar Anatum]EDW7342801.1 hypothetical protein [Salmonella enterica subsp. enterica serovar London]EEB7119036.1 hypothetical protein [Salmonella enterica subsp. enterica serovar Rubislaw]AUM33867.1 hypothetical protein LM70_24745 [Salmonella enterica subsp. enterica serovar Give]EAA9273577.1 hypothetical protein [Salmonella enterica subsp. enterica]